MMLKCKLAVLLLRIVGKTWRIRTEGQEPAAPAIIVFWHGGMLPVWKFFIGKNPIAVVSLSKDGEMLASLLGKWGYELIRGSSSKGGKEVLEEVTQSAKTRLILITPDGPKGPVYHFKPGAIIAAHRSGTPLYLCSPKIGWHIKLKKSWDKFVLPLPFASIKLVFSEHIFIKPTASREELNDLIYICEEELSKL